MLSIIEFINSLFKLGSSYRYEPDSYLIDYVLNQGDVLYGDAMLSDTGPSSLSNTGMAQITGTDAKDVLISGVEADTIFAKAGNDEVFSNGGDDYVDAGDGDDYVVAGDGNDYVLGQSGNDFVFGGMGDDKIFGMDGNDALGGDAGNDVMDGGFGNDTYIVDSVGDRVIESSSNGGIDSITTYIDNYVLPDNVENLYLRSLDAYKGQGNALSNFILGNTNDNHLSGLEGRDQIIGGSGNDTVDGGAGNDQLEGSFGDDTVIGGQGNDQLVGGAGRDVLIGGAGKDRAYIAIPFEGIDAITDFAVADDVIEIFQMGFEGGLSKGAIKANQFHIGASAQDSSDRFIYDKSTGALYFDSDGIGGAAQRQIAELSLNLAMTNKNIVVTTSFV